jgi:hypothetical protein
MIGQASCTRSSIGTWETTKHTLLTVFSDGIIKSTCKTDTTYSINLNKSSVALAYSIVEHLIIKTSSVGLASVGCLIVREARLACGTWCETETNLTICQAHNARLGCDVVISESGTCAARSIHDIIWSRTCAFAFWQNLVSWAGCNYSWPTDACAARPYKSQWAGSYTSALIQKVIWNTYA